MNYGFIQSEFDGSERIFKPSESIDIPTEYSYINFLPDVLNQGKKPICVPCSLSCNINWNININNDTNIDNNVDVISIFDSRKSGSNDGMSFKEALSFIKHNGVNTDNGLFKINSYYIIGSIIALKYAILMNGPCVGGLPVYDSNISNFWDNMDGKFEGLHAIAIVGYDKDGFIIRNSWGSSYGIDGYYHLPYEDFNKFQELWTMD